MTPQERQLVTELFDRLASLEGGARDPDADAAIRDGSRRAPNAIYALVQTVLVQDEALKVANARIQEYERELGGEPQAGERSRGFLDNMRDALLGRQEPPRSSVPHISRPGMGAPPASSPSSPWGYRGETQAPMGGMPMQQEAARPGGSFLGTAAAAAAGVVGGSLLMGGIRSMLGGHQQSGPFAGAFDQLGGPRTGDTRTPGSPGDNGGDLARQAGIDDMSRSSRTPFGDVDNADTSRRASLTDANDSHNDETDIDDDGDHEDDAAYDDGDTDNA